ncbi:MAG: HI0074 family nucleotidyltransferase substrate-binding subunit [Candidatus Eisenbacteria bacterium]
MSDEVRWKRRFQNFERVLLLLQQGLTERDWSLRSALEKTGLTKRFEFTFELAWKTLRDYLAHSGIAFDQATPRAVIKAGFAANVLPDGQVWIDMLDLRNQLSHRYDGLMTDEALGNLAGRHLAALDSLYQTSKQRAAE